MTTLPQTSPLRLPRPNGGGAMVIPGGQPVIASAPAQSAGAQMTLNDVWRVIRSNLLLIIIFVIIGGVSGYFLNKHLAQYYSRFTATGYIQVDPRSGYDPIKGTYNESSTGGLAVEQRTQSQLLRQASLFNDVLKDSAAVKETSWYNSFPSPAERKAALAEKFSVAPIPETKLIQISMTSSNPKDCKTIVEEIVEAHLARQAKAASDREFNRTTALNQLKTRFQLELRQITQDVNDKTVDLSMEGGAPGRLNIKETELSDLVKKQIVLRQEKANAEAANDAFNAQLMRGEVPSAINDIISQDGTVAQARRDVDSLDFMLVEAKLKWGEDNPNYKALQARRDLYVTKRDTAVEELKSRKTVEMRDALAAKVASSKQALDATDEQVKKLSTDLGELNNKLAQYLTRRDEESAKREELNQVKKQLELINQRTQEAQLSTVSWAISGRPAIPESPSFPKLSSVMGGCILGGLLISLGIAFLRELTDTTIRTPRDIARVGQMNMLGMIPHESDDPQSAGARLPLVIFEAPHSIMAEQLRQVRTRLQHAASLDTTRSLLVTSPSPGDGKSTVACNLAAGLALNGRRILLVDANFRRPDLHRIFGLGNEAGFSDVLNNIENFDSAVRETQVPNLSILATGPRPSNPTELLESQLLIDFIERALEEYDHVIFDSGPLLFVSESIALAPRVDGVVTVVRARTNSRGLLQRMREGLRQVKAEHLGVILNAVRSQAGGYYGRNVKTYYEYQNNEA